MLEVKNATLTYADTVIFKKLNFSVEAGKWLAIMGPSGVGKTSVLRLIADLNHLRPEEKTEIEGEVTWLQKKSFHRAYMAQQDGLFPWLSVHDNVLLPFHLNGKVKPIAEAQSLLAAVKLEKFQKYKPQSLSGGMRQRVALARTLIQHTPLVLMDEPFSALDAMTRLEMQALSFDLLRQAKKTVVLVTHDPWEALRLADTVIVLRGAPAQIKTQIELPAATSIRDITQPQMLEYYHHLMRFLCYNT